MTSSYLGTERRVSEPDNAKGEFLWNLRAKAYRRFGVLQAREALLARSVTLPTEQIIAVGLFWQREPQTFHDLRVLLEQPEQAPLRLSESFEKWLEALSRTSPNWFADNVVPLTGLADRLKLFLDCDVFGAFAELLHVSGETAYERAGHRLRDSLRVGCAEVEVLSEQFARNALPRSVRTFDLRRGHGAESRWLERVFYRYAVRAVIATRNAEKQLREFYEAPPPPEEQLLAQEEAETLASLPALLQRLPERERSAVEMYFGVGVADCESTVSEVAAVLKCSSQVAKTTIVDGLARLAARAHAETGMLDPEEAQFLRCYFGEGRTLTSAARHLGWPTKTTRRLLSTVRKKFAKGLRARTATAAVRETTCRKSQCGKGDSAMLSFSHCSTNLEFISDAVREIDNPSTIWEAVGELESAPPFAECTREETSPQREYCVKLQGRWYSLDLVRRTLLSNEDGLAKFFYGNVPLDWLEFPCHRLYRDDLPEDQAEIDEIHESLLSRAFTFAQSVVARLREAHPQWPEFDSTEGEEFAEQVLNALGRVSQLARSAMSRRLLRAGKAVLVIDRQGEPVGRWYRAEVLQGKQSEPEGDPVELRCLLTGTVLLLEGFDHEKAGQFADVILENLLDGENTFPGFSISSASHERVSLLWEASQMRQLGKPAQSLKPDCPSAAFQKESFINFGSLPRTG